MQLSPQKVEPAPGTAVDIGLPGYDECFGNGRVDALRAVTGDTSKARDLSFASSAWAAVTGPSAAQPITAL